MKHIMLSVRPEWVEKILNGEKTIEIRKTMPKCELPCKVYIYCTKDKNTACIVNQNNSFLYKTTNIDCIHIFGDGYLGNGKVVTEFTLNEITIHKKNYIDIEDNLCYNFLTDDVKKAGFIIGNDDVENFNGLCDFNDFVEEYGKGKDLYAWHIDNLEIYDKPKELSEFGLKRPPQSWCYIEGGVQ